MMKFLFLSLTIWVILLTQFSGIAQQRDEVVYQRTEAENDARPQNFGLGIGLAASFLNSDVQDNGTVFADAKNPMKFGGNLQADYSFMRLGTIGKLILQGKLGYHPVEASADRINMNNGDSYKVTDNVIDLGLALQLDFFPKSKLRPFLYFGLGYMIFDPTITTSAENQTKYASYIDNPDKGSFSIPAGGGLKYSASESFDLFAGFQKMFAFTDYLDGWASDVNDNMPIINAGLIYYFGERKKEVIEEIPIPKPAPVATDTDGDGLLDSDEKTIYKTDPTNRDTDGDGLIDGDEVKKYRTDPLVKDTDGDRLIDGDEVVRHKSDPLKKDTDGDGCNDGEEVIDMKTDPLKVDTDGDGLNDCDERNIYQTNPLIKDTDNDGTDDGVEIKQGTNPLKADVIKIEEGKRIVLEGINFETDKATILPESEETLQKAFNTLKNNPSIRVEIGGHTDNVGSASHNQRLSEARAKSVRDWLVNKGIDPARLTTKGYGETDPMVPNDSDENRAANRRIEFKILR